MKTRTLKLILNLMGSQCKEDKMGVMRLVLPDLVNSLAAALCSLTHGNSVVLSAESFDSLLARFGKALLVLININPTIMYNT